MQPTPELLTRADCESLRKIALSGTLEWVVACIMMHYHSKLLISKVCLDTVSPFVNNFEVPSHCLSLLVACCVFMYVESIVSAMAGTDSLPNFASVRSNEC